MQQTAKHIYEAIQSANHILLIPHQNPDGDALGSVTAMMEFLRVNGKKHSAFCATDITPRLHFLPHREKVTQDTDIWSDPTIDLVIVFDSGDLRYAGIAHHIDAMAKRPTIVNIDHHHTNETYGDHNLVIRGASSTAEVLHNFFTWNTIDVNAVMATALLTGLLTDTDNFTNAATSATSLAIGDRLLRAGGDMALIQHMMFKDKTVNTLRLWGMVFARLAHHATLNLVYTYITRDDLRAYGAEESDVEGIANYLNGMKEGRASLVIRELADGHYKGSFRTTRDTVDVSAWAKAMDGGGHKKAAGFMVEAGSVDEALEKILIQ